MISRMSSTCLLSMLTDLRTFLFREWQRLHQKMHEDSFGRMNDKTASSFAPRNRSQLVRPQGNSNRNVWRTRHLERSSIAEHQEMKSHQSFLP